MRSTLCQVLHLLLFLSAAFGLIDRKSLVTRHNPHISSISVNSTLTIGSGQWAFNFDATGLQTFNNTVDSLNILSDWGWHTAPVQSTSTPPIWPWSAFRWQLYNTSDPKVKVPYPIQENCGQVDQIIPCDFLLNNPSRWMLGQLAFRSNSGTVNAIPAIGDISGIDQNLDLWSGVVTSKFTYRNQYPFQVTTSNTGLVNGIDSGENNIDGVSLKVQGSKTSGLVVQLAFPPPSHAWNGQSDWSPANDNSHHTLLLETTPTNIWLHRQANYDSYGVGCFFQNVSFSRVSEHVFVFNPTSDLYEIVCRFNPQSGRLKVPTADEALTLSQSTWQAFWLSGAAIDLSNVQQDSGRALELERRIILSRYLMRAMEAGTLPPQETGLVLNSWNGRHHQEMRYWHHSHWAVWNRSDLLVPSDNWYQFSLANATAYASYQGYDGARWPKEVGAPNREYADTLPPSGTPAAYWVTPYTISSMLVWEQPHTILMAELEINSCGKNSDCIQLTQTRLSPLVDATARFMGSYPQLDNNGIYHLGIPLSCAEEDNEGNGDQPEHVYDGTFENTYWAWGLNLANTWRERQGLARNKTWDIISANLAPRSTLKYNNIEVYNFHAGCQDAFHNVANQYCPGPNDHPAMISAYGFINGIGYGIKSDIMNSTYDAVLSAWNWPSTWGWDYPLLAMTAMRLGRNDDAMNALLLNEPKNTYLIQGWNMQVGQGNLPLYMPGNGGVLTAVAMMAGGWDGVFSPLRGFPASWISGIQAEGFVPYL